MKELILLFLLGHLLGDFYFQTNKLARTKEHHQRAMLIHCFLYLAAMVLVVLPVLSWKLLGAAVLLGLLHFAVDEAKYAYVLRRRDGKLLFLIDQTVHFGCIVILSVWLSASGCIPELLGGVRRVFDAASLSAAGVLSWVTLLLLNYQPASIAIVKLIGDLKPEEAEEPATNAGRWIGLLERLIMMIFLVLQQYSAIGLVLTAKSIARYDRIARSQAFAEYYLLGTLLSTLIVVASTLLIL